MNELRRFNVYPDYDGKLVVVERNATDGDYCRADEALAAIGERDAEVKALETISENITDYYIERESKLLDSYLNEDSELLALRQKVAERDAQIDQLKKFMAFNSRSFEILIEKHDAEVDLLHGLVMAYHKREEKTNTDNEAYELEHTAWLAEVRNNEALKETVKTLEEMLGNQVDFYTKKSIELHDRFIEAYPWQPFSGTKVPCENFAGCGVIQHNDYLVVWCGQEEAAMHLPDNVRLCKMVEP